MTELLYDGDVVTTVECVEDAYRHEDRKSNESSLITVRIEDSPFYIFYNKFNNKKLR